MVSIIAPGWQDHNLASLFLDWAVELEGIRVLMDRRYQIPTHPVTKSLFQGVRG